MIYLPMADPFPLMADLDSFRFAGAEKQYSFLNVDLDFSGLFQLGRRSLKLEKQYECLLTCLVTRAVHLEVYQTLDTNRCLIAIRGSVSRLGDCEIIKYDNGSNLTSAKNCSQQNQCWQQLHRVPVLQRNFTWTLNSALTPHPNVIWEKLIQSAKRTWLIKYGSQQLKAEIFQTDVILTEELLHSRSNSHFSSDTTTKKN